MIHDNKDNNNTGKNSRKYPFPMTRKALIVYISFVILTGLYMFFIIGNTAGKACACVVCPILIVYFVYAYHKEKKADKNEWKINNKLMDESYFNSPEWHDQYVRYTYEHPFETPKYDSMKLDLLKRFQRRGYLASMLLMFFLMCCSAGAIFMGSHPLVIIGIGLFGFIFYLEFALFIGMPVRIWLKGDIDYNAVESSYLRSQMLLYNKNGLAFGTTYIHGFTEKEIYAVNYRSAEDISRKIVRLKKYENGIYSSEEYNYYTVIHVRLPQSGEIQRVEIELNEYQVQMAIDEFYAHKLGRNPQENQTGPDENTLRP